MQSVWGALQCISYETMAMARLTGPLSQAYVTPMLSVWGLSNAILMGP